MNTTESTMVNAAKMAAGITALETAYTKLRSELTSLSEDLESTLQTWSGEAKDTYYACQAAWNADCDAMVVTITTMRQVLEEITAGYAQTENHIVGEFSQRR